MSHHPTAQPDPAPALSAGRGALAAFVGAGVSLWLAAVTLKSPIFFIYAAVVVAAERALTIGLPFLESTEIPFIFGILLVALIVALPGLGFYLLVICFDKNSTLRWGRVALFMLMTVLTFFICIPVIFALSLNLKGAVIFVLLSYACMGALLRDWVIR